MDGFQAAFAIGAGLMLVGVVIAAILIRRKDVAIIRGHRHDPQHVSETLRSDARRNREKILAAASELFAQEGADLCVDDIARRAGVGHATVFRRFPTKDDLVLAMFEERLTAIAAAAEEAAAQRGPVGGPRRGDERHRRAAGERPRPDGGRRNPGLRLVPAARAPREAWSSRSAGLLRRAQEAGQVRADLEPEDVLFLISAVGQSSPCRFAIPDLWRRYLGVVLDGMRPDAASPLAPPAPTMAEVEAALACAVQVTAPGAAVRPRA